MTRADVERREAETRAARMVDVFGSASLAAHECRVQLRAIEPYTDRALSAALRVLDAQIEASPMTFTILTVYRNDVPQARAHWSPLAHWSARYEASTPAGLRGVLAELARYTGPEFRWYVTVQR